MHKYKKMLYQLGENFKLARLRRKLTKEQVCERANITLGTLNLIESGYENVNFIDYFRVLIVFDLAEDITKLASDDVLGRKLQDIETLQNEVNAKTMKSFIKTIFYQYIQ
jgi:transcriptional regulator with XRE-family HTH domain